MRGETLLLFYLCRFSMTRQFSVSVGSVFDVP